MKFKYVIKEINKNKVFTLIMIIQFIIMFFALYSLFQVKILTKNESEKINRCFKDDIVFSIRHSTVIDKNLCVKSNKQKNNLKKSFKNLLESNVHTYTYSPQYCLLMPTNNSWQQFAEWNTLNEYDGKTYYTAKHAIINKNAIERFKLKLKEGRFFTDKEYELIYNQKSIPIILGYNYLKYYKIGDKIDCGYDEKFYEVIGILEKGQYIPTDLRIMNRYKNLDTSILTNTYIYESINSMYHGIMCSNFIFYNKNLSKSQIMYYNNKLKQDFKNKLGINIKIEPQQRYVNQELQAVKNQEDSIQFACITIIAFLSITTILSKLSCINKRKKEFGVHILSGGTLKNIAFMIYFETFITIIISFLIFINIVSYRYGSINLLNIANILLISVIVSIILTIIPIIKILKFNIVDLIKGEE